MKHGRHSVPSSLSVEYGENEKHKKHESDILCQDRAGSPRDE